MAGRKGPGLGRPAPLAISASAAAWHVGLAALVVDRTGIPNLCSARRGDQCPRNTRFLALARVIPGGKVLVIIIIESLLVLSAQNDPSQDEKTSVPRALIASPSRAQIRDPRAIDHQCRHIDGLRVTGGRVGFLIL